MSQFQRLLVGLTLQEPEDRATLAYAAMLCKVLRPERVECLHSMESPELPRSLTAKHPEFLKHLDAKAQEAMHALVAQSLPEPMSAQLDTLVTKGSPAMVLVQRAKKNQVDLLIVGRKQGDSVVLPDKVARKAPCSVLVVPAEAPPRITSIVVPTDFSEHAQAALEQAIALARATGARVHLFHVYGVPLGYYKLGQSFEQAAAIMKASAEAQMLAALQKVDAGPVKVTSECVTENLLDARPARLLCEVIPSRGFDLVVMGARGMTQTAAILLGSVTEKLLRGTRVPVLVIKRKGAHLRFLEALLEL
jgi:nucleotide-binding universal stress UspA family protein